LRRRLIRTDLDTAKLSIGALRIVLVVALALCLWTAAEAKAEPPIEYLQVPSAAMGRDIPVAFLAGGPHAVYLLDAFNAAPDVSNWVTAGAAFTTLAGKGISVAAPAGGAYSMYTDWEQDGSRQWQTFLCDELPNWLAANKGLAPNGHAIVGAAQGGSGAMEAATFRPDRFRYAGSMSGYLAPERTGVDGAITAGLQQFGGVDIRNMWGLPQLGRWKWHSPNVHAQLLVNSNMRLWIYSPQTLTASDPAAMIGYPEIAQGTNRTFYAQYRAVSGANGHFDFPQTGDHGWSSWAPELAAMSNDLAQTIR
jgi:S-formylglutathione hydrolase FrmB